jgi:hypothetical protein
LFQPKRPWRPLVLVAEAAERNERSSAFYRPKQPVRPGNAAKGCKKGSGRLQGVQLELFPQNDPNFYRSTLVKAKVDPERPLADLFPEAFKVATTGPVLRKKAAHQPHSLRGAGFLPRQRVPRAYPRICD